MKTKLLFILLFGSSLGFGQFVLEHDYSNEILRVNLEYSGIKYVECDEEGGLTLYNEDHTFWKTVQIPVPDGSSFGGYTHISEGLINPDANIEVIFRYINFSGLTAIGSEDGTIFMSLNYANKCRVDTTAGLAPKLLIDKLGNSRVYSLPGLILENSYSSNNISRVDLELSGEKYYTLEYNDISLYNSDHSDWKTINMPVPEGESFGKLRFITEQEINGNSAIKASYDHYHYTGPDEKFYTSNIVTEDALVANFPDSYLIELSEIEGFEPRILVHKGGNGSPVTTEIFDLPAFELQHVFDGHIRRIKLEESGEKYYLEDASSGTLSFFDSDYLPWKEIVLAIPAGNYIDRIHLISETRLVSDSLIEVAYTYITSTSSAETTFESAVINENGYVYLTIPYARNLIISEFTAADTKLIAHLGYDSDSNPPTVLGSKVYAIDNSLETPDFVSGQIIIYPNPATSVINLSAANLISTVEIYNISGRLVKQFQDKWTFMNVEDLADGYYIAKLNSKDGSTSSHKLIIRR